MRLSMGIALLLSCAIAAPASAQDVEEDSDPCEIIAQIGAGGALSFGPEQTVPSDAEESRLGVALSTRVLWRPGHLLGIGLQSGYTRVSSVETAATDRVLHVSTIPAMIVFSMESDGFEALVATGWQRYIVGTKGRTISSAWEMSYSVAVGYTLPTASDFAIGTELSYTSMPEREIGIAALLVRGQYTFKY